jgi:predicted MFS family arabinose efflux permease
MESAGILYANVAPVIVSGLTQLEQFTAQSAGYVFSLNMAGTALGGLVAIFFVSRLPWRPAAAVLLAGLIGMDLASAQAIDPFWLCVLRFVHGLLGGLLIGVSLGVIARMVNPERTISIFIMLQLLLGGLLTILLTPMLVSQGPGIVWLSLIGLSLLALVLLPFLDDYPLPKQDGRASEQGAGRAAWRYVLLAMLALFLFQSGEMAAFAYVIEIGLEHGFALDFIGSAVAASLWIGGPAALVVTWWSTRSGRLLPLSLSLGMLVASVSLLLVPAPSVYAMANIGFGVFFSISFPYLMGVASELDNRGQMGAVAAFAGNLGLASGPVEAGMLAGGGQYAVVVMAGVTALAISWILAVSPARMLDGRNRTGRVFW